MVSKAVHLSEEEAEGLQQLLAATGESEEEILRRATVRGLRDLRLEQAIQAFKDGQSSGEAAVIAGLPRAIFFEILLDRGVVIDGGQSTLGPALEALGQALGDKRLTAAADWLASEEKARDRKPA